MDIMQIDKITFVMHYKWDQILHTVCQFHQKISDSLSVL